MKKFLALLFVSLYCISLVSCSDILNINGNKEIRTTITRDEWEKTGQTRNFSILVSAAYSIMKHADNGSLIETCKDDGSKEFASAFVNVDGVAYIIEKEDEGYIASKLEDDDADPVFAKDVASMFSLICDLRWNSIYDKLVYVEDCKTYTCTTWIPDGQDFVGVQIEVECENGNVKEMRLCILGRDYNEPLPGILTFYDFGTTVVEIPEYTFAD